MNRELRIDYKPPTVSQYRSLTGVFIFLFVMTANFDSLIKVLPYIPIAIAAIYYFVLYLKTKRHGLMQISDNQIVLTRQSVPIVKSFRLSEIKVVEEANSHFRIIPIHGMPVKIYKSKFHPDQISLFRQFLDDTKLLQVKTLDPRR